MIDGTKTMNPRILIDYRFLVATALLLLAGWADYELQAFQHGWAPTGVADMSWRAPKWICQVFGVSVSLDFIPHDPWHIAQSIRNIGMIAGPMCIVFWYARSFPERAPGHPYFWQPRFSAFMFRYRYYLVFAAAFALHAVTRGVTFSLLYRILN